MDWSGGNGFRYAFDAGGHSMGSSLAIQHFAIRRGNLVTKVEPLKNSFNDGDYRGWSTTGAWDASDHYMTRPHCV